MIETLLISSLIFIGGLWCGSMVQHQLNKVDRPRKYKVSKFRQKLDEAIEEAKRNQNK